MTRFTDALWAEIRPTYEAILDLPFNRELAAGTLSRERFVFYMVQDAHYLGAFARALATAAAKATTPEAQVTFAKSAHEAIVVERALHEGFFREFGVSAERFAATRPSPTCAGYSDFLLATAYQHPFQVAAAALLPCFQIYYEVGKHLYPEFPIWIRPTRPKVVEMLAKRRIPSFTRRVRQGSAT
jgi:thiaminase/transcriptional activator TenA